jgi:hypothetical protein
MPRMLDMIRNSQVPANLMQSAVRGALSVPPEETIEILVYLAVHHKLFGEQARLTLAGWDEKASLDAAANPSTSAEVLGYFASLENLRPSLLPALAENPSVSEEVLDGLAVSGSRSVVETLLTSPRVLNSPHLLQALQSNPNLRPNELAEVGKKLGIQISAVDGIPEVEAPDEVIESTVTKYLEENAAEIEVEKDKPFQPIGMEHEAALSEPEHSEPVIEPVLESVVAPIVETAVTVAPVSPEIVAKPASDAAKVTPVRPAIPAKKRPPVGHEKKRDSVLQTISKLDIRGRITLAMRGSKEDRSILIRDSTKLVAIAVLESPKVSDGEVEKFALQKNVLEAVLRAIPMKRRFAKNYNIMRNLVQNPRTPIDLSLGLMKGLLIHDLKNLSGNKEVSDTIRKLALRMYKQKSEKKG